MLLYSNPSSTELNIILNVNKSSNNTSINLVDNTGRLVFESGIDLIKGVNYFTFPINTPLGRIPFCSHPTILLFLHKN
jgi:hypothetical protein